ILHNGRNHLQVVHALWTLEGLMQLNLQDVQTVLGNPQWQIQAQAIVAAVSLASTVSKRELVDLITAHVSTQDTLLMPYAALAIESLGGVEGSVTEKWALERPDNRYLADALISGRNGRERPLLASIANKLPDTTSVLYQ